MIAFIPARSGSSRIKHKNIRDLGGHPLIAYTIKTAIESKCFSDVIVSSDSDLYLEIAQYYGASVIKRPADISTTYSSDQEWIDHAFSMIDEENNEYAILRPTNPFRTVGLIKKGIELFNGNKYAWHVRSVEVAQQHPFKMWRFPNGVGDRIVPFLGGHEDYLNQTSTLPKVYLQNGALEIRRTVGQDGIVPLMTGGYESLDINTVEDWILADELIRLDPSILINIEEENIWKQRVLQVI